METPKGERFSDLRLEQAVDVGAEVLVTACPYCITNFDGQQPEPGGRSKRSRSRTSPKSSRKSSKHAGLNDYKI